MAKQYPNNTSQSGIYYTGSGGYVDVDSSFALASEDYVTFATRATLDSWANGDTVDILIRKSEGNLKIWTATWDATNEYLLLDDEQDTKGTISDSDAVEVTSVITASTVSLPSFKCARLHHRDTQQTSTLNATQYMEWDGVDFENSSGDFWDSAAPTDIVIPADGYYEATFGYLSDTKYTSAVYTSIFIRLNGTSIAGFPGEWAGYGPPPVHTGVLYLETGDVLTAGIYGRAMTTHASDKHLFFAINKVGY